MDLKKIMKKPSMMFKSLPPKQKKNKKKKSRAGQELKTYSDEINDENQRNEQELDDITSDSSSSSSSCSSGDEAFLRGANKKHEVIVREEDFEEKEQLKFTNDVYNYTICANMTKCCSPLQQGFALKQCFIVFGVQILVALFFLIDIGIQNY